MDRLLEIKHSSGQKASKPFERGRKQEAGKQILPAYEEN